MRMRFRLSLGWYLMTLVIGVTVVASAIGTPSVDAASAGQPAYDFQGTTLDGQQVSLSSYAGKPLVLVFLASW